MPRLLITLFAFVIFHLSIFIPNCHAETTLQAIGPFGGYVGVLAIDPVSSQTLYAGTYNGSIYKTTNGGASWIKINNTMNSGYIYSLATDPTDSLTVYAGTDIGLFKSIDGGVSWTNTTSGIATSDIYSIAIDPNNHLIIYIGMSGSILKSTNGGKLWATANSGPEGFIKSIVIDPTNSQTIYSATYPSGIYKSTNAGTTWTAINGGVSSTVVGLTIDPINNATIYAATAMNGGPAYKTTNGGNTWVAINNSTSQSDINCFAVDPKDSRIIYAGTSQHVLKSTDGGSSWANKVIPIEGINSIVIDPFDNHTIYYASSQNIYKSTNSGNLLRQSNNGIIMTDVHSLAIDPVENSTVFAGTGHGLYKSSNGGSRWSSVSSELISDVDAIAIDPVNTETIYVGTWGVGVYKTSNGGSSWIRTKSDLVIDGRIMCLAVDPTNHLTIYAGTPGGLVKSSDGGTSWNIVYNSGTEVYSIVIDSNNSQTVYIGTVNGMYKSSNGGNSWVLSVNGMPRVKVYSLAIDPSNTQTVFAGTDGGFYISHNSGGLWALSTNGMVGRKVLSLAVDSANGQKIYAGTNYGLYTSTNSGALWSVFNNSLSNSYVYSLAIEPTYSGSLYIGTSSKGTYKTILSSSFPIVNISSDIVFIVDTQKIVQITSSGWPAPLFSLSGVLPSGLTFDATSGTISGTPSSGTAGSYPLIITAANGVPPDAVRSLLLTVLPASTLAATITTPAKGAGLSSLAGITGTASGTGLSRIEIQITDGTYYLQSSGTFSTTPAWLTASGTSNWSYDTSTIPWREGITYTILARASDGSTTSVPATSTSTIQIPTTKTGTILTLADIATLRAGNSTTVSGTLVKADTTAASNQSVTLLITPPTTATTPNPALITIPLTTDTTGAFASGSLSNFALPGVYMVQARYEGTTTLAASFASQALGVTPQSGYAIIVSGKAADNDLLDLHTASTDSIYTTLVTKRGFFPENINYLKSTTSAAVTKQQIQDAITVWAKDKLSAAPGPLYLFLIDHGTTTGFVLDDQTLTPDDLKGYLDTLESDTSVVGSGTLSTYKRFVIIGTCYSGTFIDKLSKPGRVIITSAANDERSIAGFSIYNSATNTTFSGGEYFIDTLINFLGRGDNFKDAVTQASTNVALRDPRTVAPGFHSSVYDSLAQHPLLDDNGDTTGSYNLDGSADGTQASILTLGVGRRSIGNPADITAVTSTAFIPADQGTDYPLWLTVNDNSRISKAWMEIRTPNTAVTGGSSSGQVIPSLVTLPLYYDGLQWQHNYTFSASGTYSILYYTQDNQTGDISPAAHSVIYKNKSGNTTPAAFNLLSPDDSSAQSTMFTLAWQEVPSANPLTYTLLVSTDQNFGTIVYKEESIPQATTYIADGKLKNSATGTYYCQSSKDTWCYWKIQAIDSYGAITESDVRRFTTVLTNGLPSILKGYVRSLTGGGAIAGASISTGASNFKTLSNGAYLIIVSTGNVSLNVSATGYQAKKLSNLNATAGKILANDIILSITSSAKLGDCNNDNTVTIAEVQSAINMFLGLKAPATCVDLDNSSGVSIAEVQKVINSFLGL
jgi:photosystem II stability/assembly factor-like uncharacterized protein